MTTSSGTSNRRSPRAATTRGRAPRYSPTWPRTPPWSASNALPKRRRGRSRPCLRRPGAEPELERRALYALAWTRSLGGRAIDDVWERFRSASREPAYIAHSPGRVVGQRLVWRGEIAAARAVFTRQLAEADERGEPSSYALQRLHLCELELRAGAWDAAEHVLDEWAESGDRELLHWPMYERCRALLAAGRGLPDEARRWGAEAETRARAAGVRWDQLEALRALAIAELLVHETDRAAERLHEVWEHTGPGGRPRSRGVSRGRRPGRGARGARRAGASARGDLAPRATRGGAGSSMGARDRATLRGAHCARARLRRSCRDGTRARPRMRTRVSGCGSMRRGRCSPSAGSSGALGNGAPPGRRSSARRPRSTTCVRRDGPNKPGRSSSAWERGGPRRRES